VWFTVDDFSFKHQHHRSMGGTGLKAVCQKSSGDYQSG